VAGVRWGLPIAEDDYLNVGLSIDRTTLKTDATARLRYQNYVATFGAKSNTLLTTLGWQKDGRDSLLVTTKGSLRRAVLEVSLPGSTATYVRATYQHQHFFPLDRRLTLALNGEVGVAKSVWQQGPAVLQELLCRWHRLGAWLRLRFPGPARYLTLNEAIGGDKRLIGNAELLFPVPGMGRDNSMRLSVFMDAGNVWGYDSKFSLGSLRYSGGVALAWNSPMGPLKFSYANPFNKKPKTKCNVCSSRWVRSSDPLLIVRKSC
jgi:outer membrane protein insertion porin family